MKDINTVTEIGRLTKDSTIHTFENGSAVIQFTIAVNNTKKEGDKFVDVPCFIPVKYYGKNLDKLSGYLTKGKQVAVSGYLSQDKWEKDGKQNSVTFITAESVELCGSTKKEDQRDQPELPDEGVYVQENIPF